VSVRNYIPSEHMVMVWIASGILALAGIAYLFAPQNKSEAFLGIMTLAGGFIFGKFSNGYASKRSRRTDVSPAGDEPGA
jgi:hypothetical protein